MLCAPWPTRALVDEPIAIGITKGVESDHAPHFHEAAE